MPGAAAAEPSTAPPAVTVGFSPGDAEAVVVRTIAGAQTSVRLAAYSFTSKPIATALVAASKRGVEVMVVVDKSQRSERYTSATFLANMGIPVRVDSRYAIMHNKFMVVDGHTVQTGSFNYTASAARRNAENVIVVAGAPDMVSAYDAEWRRLWNESEPYGPRY
ncbi:endonuclease [Rhodanobacter sp. FW510-R10]|nr:endonuclease [Rhodanobacter sp. FW510-R10]